MHGTLWIVAADRLGAVIMDGTGAEIARARAPALPERHMPPHEVSARDRLLTGAMAVKLRAWLLAERAAGRLGRIALVAPPDVLAQLRLRIEDGLADLLVACIASETDPADAPAVLAKLATVLAEEAA